MNEPLPFIVHVAAGREWRGGERQVLLLARELGRCGVSQAVVTRDGGRLARELGHAGLDVHGVPWRGGLSLAALGSAWRLARRPGAVLHAHDGHAITIAAAAGLLARRPFVVTRRTAFPVRRPATWRRAERVIAISSAVAGVLEDAGIPAERIVLVPSGIDVGATRATEPRSIRADLGLPIDAPLAVCVAAFTHEKDHDTLLRAAAIAAERAPRLSWALAGDGPLRPHLVRLARDLGIEQRIHFIGWLDDPLPLIAAADVMVLTSVVEGMGSILLDGLALGVPIVATAAGGIPEAVGDGALLTPPRSPEAVAAAVVQLLDDSTIRNRLRGAASTHVERRTAAGMAQRVRDVYRSVTLKH